jgi:hypothetical protein
MAAFQALLHAFELGAVFKIEQGLCLKAVAAAI